MKSAKMPPVVGGAVGTPAWAKALYALMHDPLSFFLTARATAGDLYTLDLGVKQAVVLNHPRHAAYVLRENSVNYVKGGTLQTPLRTLVGQGLVASTGAQWRQQRSALQPWFRPHHFADWFPGTVNVLDAELAQWDAHATNPGAAPFDLSRALSHLTTQITSRLLFGAHVAPQTSVALTEACHVLTGSLAAGVVAGWLPTPWRRLLVRRYRANQQLDRCLNELIATYYRAADRAGRPQPIPPGRDLMSVLLQTVATDATDVTVADVTQQLRDQVLTLFVSAAETTTASLHWTLLLLLQHPHVADSVRTEIDRTIGATLPTLADLSHLPTLHSVLRESLRLYPPGWRIARVAQGADEIDGCVIPAGSSVLTLVYALHRHPDVWAQPAQFQPERFAPENASAIGRYDWLPFGAGQRRCIGAEFAMRVMQLVVTALFQRYTIHPAGALAADRVRIASTLQSRRALRVHLRKRRRA